MLKINYLNRLVLLQKNQPRLAPYVSKLCAQLMSADEKVNYSYKIFASNRDVKFQEMEYAVGIEDCPKDFART